MLRIIKHLLIPAWFARRLLPKASLVRIEAAIRESELTHRGELRFAMEASLDLLPLLRGQTPRARALEVFSDLRVRDTEENSGVLVYLQLVDRDFEIVADRGINARVTQDEWETICRRMEHALRERRFEAGVITGLRDITALLTRHFPARAGNTDELSNKPVVL